MYKIGVIERIHNKGLELFEDTDNAVTFIEWPQLIDKKPTKRAATAWIKNQHIINRRG